MAQFVGPTGAELQTQAYGTLASGMSGLAQFGQWLKETRIKGKTGVIQDVMKRFGGLKEMVENEQGKLLMKDFMKEFGYDDTQASAMLDSIVKDQPTYDEAQKQLANIGIKMVDEGGGGQETSTTTAATTVSAASPASAPQGGGPTSEWADLWAWDKGAGGAYGPQVQQAWQKVMDLQNKYKAQGLQPEDQGEPGKPRLMYFTPAIANRLLAQAQNVEAQAQQQQPGMGVAGAGSANVRANPAQMKPLINKARAEIEADLKTYTDNIAIIDQQGRVPEGQALKAQGAVGSKGEQYGQMTDAQAASAMTAANRAVAQPVTAPVAGGPTAAAPVTTATSATPEVPTNKAAAALTEFAAATQNMAGMSGQDIAKAKVFADRWQKTTTLAESRRLAQEDPKSFYAFLRSKAQDEAFNSWIMMAVDPKSEIAYQRSLKSGEAAANVAYLQAQTRKLQADIENLPMEMETKKQTALAAVAEAQARLAETKSAPELLAIKRQMLGIERDKAAMELEALRANNKNPALKEAYAVYLKLMEGYDKVILQNQDPKSGKLIESKMVLDSINISAKQVNSAIDILNSQLKSAGGPTTYQYTHVPEYSYEGRNWLGRTLGMGTIKNIKQKGTSEQAIDGSSTPPVTPTAPVAEANTSQKKVDDFAKGLGY